MRTRTVARRLGKLVIDNSPALFAAAGITGVITTAVLTGRATFKAADILRWDENERAKSPDDLDPATTKEKVQLVWKVYIPPAAAGSLCVVAIVLATHVSTRRAAAIATAYSLSQKAFDEYREQVAEKFGERKERAVRDELAQSQVARSSDQGREVVLTEGTDVLCHDAFTGRYFKSSVERLRKFENQINHKILHECYASLSDFYDLVGLKRTDYSDEIGWKNDQLVDLRFSATLTDQDEPCISISFRTEPVREYYRLG